MRGNDKVVHRVVSRKSVTIRVIGGQWLSRMNVMREKCVIPACLAKSTNNTPYCSDYHRDFDK